MSLYFPAALLTKAAVTLFTRKVTFMHYIVSIYLCSMSNFHHAKFKGFVSANKHVTLHRILTFLNHGIAIKWTQILSGVLSHIVQQNVPCKI